MCVYLHYIPFGICTELLIISEALPGKHGRFIACDRFLDGVRGWHCDFQSFLSVGYVGPCHMGVSIREAQPI